MGSVHAGDLELAAQAGDPGAHAELERAPMALAAGLRSVTAALDPRIIVLGGGLLGTTAVLTGLLHRHWATQRPLWSATELRPARFGAGAGLYGAALLAARH